MNYAELHCLSNFSFLRGASHPHELVRVSFVTPGIASREDLHSAST